MPVVPLKEIVDRAFDARYGVAAINIVNDLTLEGVLAAAVEKRSPVIVQTSVKTVRSIGSDVLMAMWRSMTAGIEVPVTSASRSLSRPCGHHRVPGQGLEFGPVRRVRAAGRGEPAADDRGRREAHAIGAHVEGEIESITGVEDDLGSDEESKRQTLEVSLNFIEATGVDVFAPSIGNAHGIYARTPELDCQRVTDIVEAAHIPIALHGGSGMTDDQFPDLIARGCAKVNISTALKVAYMKSNLEFLRDAEDRNSWDPPSLFKHVRADVVDLVDGLVDRFGSAGKAW